jgi:ABC-2 type transport system permease protein
MTKTLRDYRLLATWEFEAILPQLTVIFPIQFLFPVLLSIGLGFFVPGLDGETARYLSTGAPTIAVLMIGLVVLPNQFAQRKQTGETEFYRTLPIAPPVALAASLTPPILVALPGSFLALLVAAWHFDFSLDPSPLALVAIALVTLTGAAIGNAIAAVSSHPQVTNLLTNVIVFFIFLFSPINFPIENLPGWLQSLHEVLPIEPMAELVRSTLTGASTAAGDWLYVAIWAVGSFLLSATVSSRRE